MTFLVIQLNEMPNTVELRLMLIKLVSNNKLCIKYHLGDNLFNLVFIPTIFPDKVWGPATVLNCQGQFEINRQKSDIIFQNLLTVTSSRQRSHNLELDDLALENKRGRKKNG